MMTRVCDMLPPVRGTYAYDAPLKDLVWFRAGGPAEILFRPADSDDLATFLAARPEDLRVSVIGVGSNLLVRDGGIPGVTVRLPSAFGKIETDGMRVRAGAAALDAAVARAAAEAGIAGLEFLRGVPGTIGVNFFVSWMPVSASKYPLSYRLAHERNSGPSLHSTASMTNEPSTLVLPATRSPD